MRARTAITVAAILAVSYPLAATADGHIQSGSAGDALRAASAARVQAFVPRARVGNAPDPDRTIGMRPGAVTLLDAIEDLRWRQRVSRKLERIFRQPTGTRD